MGTILGILVAVISLIGCAAYDAKKGLRASTAWWIGVFTGLIAAVCGIIGGPL